MPYQVLARKYRPLRFSDVVGQDHVTRTLLNALAQDRIAHGYIFSGHRGIGKTTIARILASALNCRNPIGSEARPTPEPCNQCESCLEIRSGNAVDVIEIDAATNRGIDEIRELRDAARYRPARDRFKIYILDEAHQITDAAFNALLKTLEEPPDHIVFMMATTQPEDIPQTIRSRCQHFSFHAVKLEDIVGQLRKISADENILVDDATLALLAEAGDGSMRDALSIMDQAIASAPLDLDFNGVPRPRLLLEQIRELMGTVSNAVYEQVLEAVHANSSADVINIVGRLLDAGNGPAQLARQFVRFLRNCVVAKITALNPNAEATGIAADLLQISPEERSRAARSAQLFTEEDLSRFLNIILRTFDELGYRQEQRFHLELGLLKLVHTQRLLPIEDLLSQLGPSTSTPGNPLPTTPRSTATSAIPATSVSPSRPAPPPSTSTNAGPTLSTPPQKPGAPRLDSETWAGTNVEKPRTPSTTASSSSVGSNNTEPSQVPPTAPVSPFDSDRTRKAPQASSPDLTPSISPAPVYPKTEGSLAIATEPVASLAAAPAPIAVPSPQPTAASEPSASIDLAALQAAMVAALAEANGQETASQQIEDATLSLNAGAIEIQTQLSKTMLPIAVNADANRILQTVLRAQAPGTKFVLLPGAPASSSAKKASRPARAGSAAELAEKHPIVQQAKRLFSADISNIIDLREK